MGLRPTGNISFGKDVELDRIRVPNPAAGITAFLISKTMNSPLGESMAAWMMISTQPLVWL